MHFTLTYVFSTNPKAASVSLAALCGECLYQGSIIVERWRQLMIKIFLNQLSLFILFCSPRVYQRSKSNPSPTPSSSYIPSSLKARHITNHMFPLIVLFPFHDKWWISLTHTNTRTHSLKHNSHAHSNHWHSEARVLPLTQLAL